MRLFLPILAVLFGLLPLAAQPPAPVGYSTVVDHAVQQTLRLPGSVESRRYAVVAAEVAGLVVDLDVLAGDEVAAGQVLARLRRTTYEIGLRAAEGRLREAQARLELAENKLGRAESLFEDEVISQDGLDDASSEFTAWQARIDQAQAEIDRIRDNLEQCEIRAPFAGVITDKRTEVGEWIVQGGPVVEIVSLDDIEVRVDVPERWFGGLLRGGEARVAFEALPEMEIAGRVREIVPRADPQARSFPVKVRIDNPGHRVGVGMLAVVELPVGGTQAGLIVPKDAVVRSGRNEMVFVIGEDQTVRPVPVASVKGMGQWVAIEGPLAAGDRVVTRGNERLRPGQAVEATLEDYPLP